jgi:hypothetical protein
VSKAINAFINTSDETSENVQGVRLIFLDFDIPKHGSREQFIPSKNNKTPHERVVTEVREVKYLRDGFVKEDNITRKIVLESHGTEIVKEILVPQGHELTKTAMVKVVGNVTRDLRRKEENV